MDLRSCRTHASWHPLTSLILLFDGGWADRPFYGIPFLVADTPFEQEEEGQGDGSLSKSPRSAISTIHHELTHLWCAKTTRLGWALGIAAAKAIKLWRDARPIDVSVEIETILGAYTPILEGLALYAELDFQATDPEAILSNPITVHAQMVEFDRRTIESTLWYAREMAILGANFCAGPSLLRLLFLDSRQADRSYYLAGYLWIKAVAAILARRCPALARPAKMFPLLVRLLCDHPAISKALFERSDASALVRSIHESMINLSPRALSDIAIMLDRVPEATEFFDLWDIHGQIASGQFSDLIRTSDTEYRRYFAKLDGSTLERELNVARSAAQMHLLAKTEGEVLSVSEDATEIELRVFAGEHASTQSIHLIPIENFWALAKKHSGKRPDIAQRIEKFFPVAFAVQEKFQCIFRESIGRRITLANYMSFPVPESFGLVLWQDWSTKLPKRIIFPFDWSAYDETHEAPIQDILSAGTAMSPAERLRFSQSIKTSPNLAAATVRATSDLFQLLIGNARRRRLIANQRFAWLPEMPMRDIIEWVEVPPFRSEPWRLGDVAATFLNEIVDLPGFAVASIGEPLLCTDLLPIMPVTNLTR